jgi:hypothetical protein
LGQEWGQKNSKGTISITNFENRIRLRWRYDDTFPSTGEVFVRNLAMVINTFDRYLSGIMTFMYGRVTPQAAIAQVENITNPVSN